MEHKGKNWKRKQINGPDVTHGWVQLQRGCSRIMLQESLQRAIVKLDFQFSFLAAGGALAAASAATLF